MLTLACNIPLALRVRSCVWGAEYINTDTSWISNNPNNSVIYNLVESLSDLGSLKVSKLFSYIKNIEQLLQFTTCDSEGVGGSPAR